MSMRVLGSRTNAKAEATNATRTEVSTLETLLTTSPRDKESTLGKTARSMMASGTKARRRGMVSGEALQTSATSVSGRQARHMATASTSGRTGTSMRASGKIVSSMAMDLISSEMATLIRESTDMESLRVSANTSGRAEVSISVISRLASSMAKASGVRATSLIATIMRASITWTKSTDTESSPGKAVIYTKAITLTMSEMGMAKCIGQMAQSTKVNGKKAVSTGLEK